MALTKILPLGFDDERVKGEVVAAYQMAYNETHDRGLVLDLLAAGHHAILMQALKTVKLQRYITQVAQELADGRISATEAAEAVSDYASKL